jgi:hypothetical protein
MQTVSQPVTQLSCPTPAVLSNMADDELAGYVINGLRKFEYYLPHIKEIKKRFAAAPRDSHHRLLVPIRDCYSWKEFCLRHLDRTRQAIEKACKQKPTREDYPQDAAPAREEVLERAQLPRSREEGNRRIAEDFREMANLYKDYSEWAPVFQLAETIAKGLGV